MGDKQSWSKFVDKAVKQTIPTAPKRSSGEPIKIIAQPVKQVTPLAKPKKAVKKTVKKNVKKVIKKAVKKSVKKVTKKKPVTKRKGNPNEAAGVALLNSMLGV